jgi:exodeoxyribonuclease VII large subunit
MMADADRSLAAEADLGTDDVVTVATLNGEIANVVEDNLALSHDFIVGDISDCTESSGHIHFDLVHNESSIHCVLFGFRRSETSVTPEEGMQVAVTGDLSFYEPRGSCSILVTDVVDMGESEYSQVYQKNKEALERDGLLANERKQNLPDLPTTVGIVTSADSDARTDAVKAIHNRYPDIDIVVKDATVQGPEALEELMGAVSALEKDAAVDLIVVTRGGGADKTLRVFNESPLCRVIAGTDKPIVVGIGHEDDRTLADEVADSRVMTPTHVGGVVPEKDALEGDIEQYRERLNTAYETAVDREVTAYATALDNAYREASITQLQDLEARLDYAAQRCIESRIQDLGVHLDSAYTALEREREHEAELEATVEEVREEAHAETQAEVESMQRRYRVAVIVLILLVLGLGILYLI